MSQVNLTINPEDPNYKPSERSFASRAEAQTKVNEFYVSRYIDRKEWNRLTDELSVYGHTKQGSTPAHENTPSPAPAEAV